MPFQSNTRLPNSIVESLLKDKSIRLFCYSGKFFIYEDNYYKEIHKMQKWIFSYINNRQIITTEIVKEVESLLHLDKAFELDESRYQIEPARYINFRNGILDLKKRKLIPHTPNIIFFSKIPYDYNPNALTDIMTEKLISNFVKSESKEEAARKRALIFEVLGVVLSNVRELKNFLFIQGVKDTGKSTYCGLIQKLIGDENYSSLPIHEMNEGSFHLHEIIGKKANILTETSDMPLKDITTLKKLTGGGSEKIMCKIKYVKQSQQITPKALLIFAGNTIPPLWNGGDKNAFVERMIPVKFESKVAEADKITNILDKVSYEYIIKEAIERLYEFLDNNKVFTQPAQSKEMRNDLLNADDIVKAFVDDCDTTDKNYKILTKVLYEIFQLWAKENGFTITHITSNLLTRRLKDLGFVNKKMSIDNSPSLAGFLGINPPKYFWGSIVRNNAILSNVESIIA